MVFVFGLGLSVITIPIFVLWPKIGVMTLYGFQRYEYDLVWMAAGEGPTALTDAEPATIGWALKPGV